MKFKAWDGPSSPGWWYIHVIAPPGIIWLQFSDWCVFCFITFVMFRSPLSLDLMFFCLTRLLFHHLLKLLSWNVSSCNRKHFIYNLPFTSSESTISLGGHFTPSNHFPKRITGTHLSETTFGDANARTPAGHGQRHHGSSWSAFCRRDFGADFSCQALGTCLGGNPVKTSVVLMGRLHVGPPPV